MNVFGNIFRTWPIQELLNYIFKKTLGDYILNDLNLNLIEIKLTNQTSISLTNIELNAYEINNKHFNNSPLKMLEGKINKLDLTFEINSGKIKINIEEVLIILMPVFNLTEFNQNKITKKGLEIKSDNKSEVKKETSLISNLLNSALSNLEVTVTNICIKILTYY